MTTKHFLNLRDLSNQDILNILDRAIERKSQKQKEKTLIGSKLHKNQGAVTPGMTESYRSLSGS